MHRYAFIDGFVEEIRLAAAGIHEFMGEGNLSVARVISDTLSRRVLSFLDANEKDPLLAAFAHDIRTQLVGIGGYLELQQTQGKEYRPHVSRSLVAIEGKLAEVARYGQILDRRGEIRPESIDVYSLLDRSVIELGAEDHIVLDREPYRKGKRGRIATVDPVLGVIVFNNLINNALNHGKGEGVRIEVNGEGTGYVESVVADEGPGMPPERADMLFRGRYKGPGSRGTGLGLYVSGEIVRMHGGEIGVTSELGRGAKFYFTLPEASKN